MNREETDEILKTTLEDAIFSRAEKDAIKQLLIESFTSPEKLSFFRNRCFYVARNALRDHEPELVFKWLEGVNKTIHERLSSGLSTTAGVCFSPGIECRLEIQNQLKQAKSSVDICVFTITDNEITNVIEQTHRRGVPIRIITDNDKSHDRGSDIQRLAEMGVAIKMDDSDYHMHHKFAVFDKSLLLTGSYNWTRSAADFNEENILSSDDLRFVQAFTREFERLWSNF